MEKTNNKQDILDGKRLMLDALKRLWENHPKPVDALIDSEQKLFRTYMDSWKPTENVVVIQKLGTGQIKIGYIKQIYGNGELLIRFFRNTNFGTDEMLGLFDQYTYLPYRKIYKCKAFGLPLMIGEMTADEFPETVETLIREEHNLDKRARITNRQLKEIMKEIHTLKKEIYSLKKEIKDKEEKERYIAEWNDDLIAPAGWLKSYDTNF